MSRVDSRVWFGEVIPGLARLLLRLPSLLETHYRNADEVFGGRKAGLRIMAQQEAGIVFLSQVSFLVMINLSMFCKNLIALDVSSPFTHCVHVFCISWFVFLDCLVFPLCLNFFLSFFFKKKN